MTAYSSFPGSVEFIAPPGGSIDDENFFGEIPWLNLKLELVLIYGSLPRPPDIQSTVACTCFLTLLSTNEESRTVDVVDDLAFWRYAHREGELRLHSLKQILEYGIDNGWLVKLLEHPVFTSKTQSLELLSKDCNEDRLILIFHLCTFTRLCLHVKTSIDFSEALLVHVELLSLLFMVCEADPLLLLLTFGGLRIGPPAYGCLEALLISFAMRLIQSDAPRIVENALTVELLHFFNIRKEFQRHDGLFKNMEIASDQCYLLLVCLCHDKGNSHVSAPMRRMEYIFQLVQLVIWFVKFLPRLEKETFFFTCWLVYHEGYASPRYATRQGEIWSSRTNSMVTLIQGDSGEFGRQGTLLHFDSRELLMLIFLHPHCCEFLLSQRWWVSKKMLIFIDCHVLLLQGQSRELYFLGYKIAAHTGGLRAIHWFFFGSLTRPPECHGRFQFHASKVHMDASLTRRLQRL